MIPTLAHLITEAKSLANDHPCLTTGHLWESDGGRTCPKGWSDSFYHGCSQTVYRCSACGQHDYGDKGGPAWDECFLKCKREDDF